MEHDGSLPNQVFQSFTESGCSVSMKMEHEFGQQSKFNNFQVGIGFVR